MPAPDHPENESEAAREEYHRRAERRHWFFEKVGGSVALLFTAIAGGGAIASAIASFGAWNAATEAVTKANRQAVAAETQIAVAKDTEIRQLRAYVFATAVTETFKYGEIPSAMIKFRALGLTPAYKLHATAVGGIFRFPPPSDKELETNDVRERQISKAALYPAPDDGLILQYPLDGVYPDQVLDEVRKENISKDTIRFFLIGGMTYQDAFGCKHSLRYCIGLGGVDLSPRDCADRNESDDPGTCTK